jgi:hypothetical protein
MRKFIQAMLLGLALCAASFAATRIAPVQQVLTVATETDEQAAAAFSEFNKFAADHNLTAGYRNSTPDTWDLAFFVNDADGQASGDPKWVVYGYHSVTAAVKQIEADYAKYPDGHDDPSAPVNE